MKILSYHSIEEVLALALCFNRVQLKSFHVNFKKPKWRTFAKSTTCACCGLQANIAVLEKRRRRNPKKGWLRVRCFNLYNVTNGVWTLMTCDHILPQSKGGTDDGENLQTLCTHCNTLKADRLIENRELQCELV